MSLGNNIYRLRTGRGLSQGDLAEALQVSRQSISKWETDSSTPDLDKLLALSDLFGVTLDDLVHGEVPETIPLKTPEHAVSEKIPAAAQPASGQSSALRTVVIVILALLGLWLLFSLFMSPSLWPGLLVLLVIGGLGFALWTRIREDQVEQADLENEKKHPSSKMQLLKVLLIGGLLLLPFFGLANSLPAAPIYAKAGKESTLTPQEYPGVRFVNCGGTRDNISYALVNETDEIITYDASEQLIEVKKGEKWYRLKKRTDSESASAVLLQPGRGAHIQIFCEELYGNLPVGEYRVLLQVYPLSESGKAQWIAEEFTIRAAYQLP